MRRMRMVLAVMGLVSVFASPVRAAERVLDDTPRIAVMSAYEPEWQIFLAATENQKEYVLNGRRYVTGSLGGKNVLLFLSGISMVNASMSTQQAIDRFNVSSIVFSGIAGGVDPSLSIGDVVVADQWGEYLEAVFARETNGTYTLPPYKFIADPFKNYGMIFPNTVEVFKDGLDKPERRFWFPVDGKLLDTARAVAGSVALERCAAQDKCLGHTPKVVVGGNGVSGQAFVDNAQFRTYAFDNFKARVLDMESAATAHVAYANGVPFIAFRSLSDLAGGGDEENQLGVFFAMASTNSARVVIAFLTALR